MWIADRPSGNDMETLKLGSQGSGAPEHIGELLFSGEARWGEHTGEPADPPRAV